MPKPYSIKPRHVAGERRQPVPCRGGKPHHWKLGDPVDGRVPGFCPRCHRKRDFPASVDMGYTAHAILTDPLPRRNNVGGFGAF